MSGIDVSREWLSRLPGLDRLWSLTKGCAEIRIAVLDGPADRASLAQPSLLPSGVVEHGTLVQSIIAGSSDAVIPGLAPGCTVVSIPIFEKDADPGCSQADLAQGIRAAMAEGASIINVSASQQADPLAISTDLSATLQDAIDLDILVVAAAGNHGCACDTIPGSAAGVLAVGAHDGDGVPLLTSNWGPNQRTQGLTAPGLDVPGACVGGGLCRASGTSFAAATVSGVAGLLMSVDHARGIAPSGARIRKILLDSSTREPNGHLEMASRHLSGRLNVSRAADFVLASPQDRRGRSIRGRNTREDKLIASAEPDAEGVLKQSQPPAAASEESAGPPLNGTVPRAEGRRLVPADCGCGGGDGEPCTCKGAARKPQLVYAIGRLGVSFISQARRDSIWRTINEKRKSGEKRNGNEKRNGDLKPITDATLQQLFNNEPFHAQSVVWTLSRTEVPMYAIVASGPFAAETYKWLVDEWSDTKVEFVAVPGVLAGQVALYDGNIVDVVVPDLRGMRSWETKTYVKALTDARKKAKPALSDAAIEREINRFLGKIYFSIRNRGLAPEERALNAAATNAFNFGPVITEAGEDGMTLRDITVERSPLNRPGSEYFDVLLTFFDPEERNKRAPLRSRFTIDVSDTVPVMIGDPVTWNEY